MKIYDRYSVQARQDWANLKFNYLRDLNKDSHNCHYCNTELSSTPETPISCKVTLDHIIPICKGGDPLDLNNIVISCGKCNRNKGDMELEKFLHILAKKRKTDKKFQEFFFEKFGIKYEVKKVA